MTEPDQDVAPAVKRRKQSHRDRRLRAALEAYDLQQLLREYELNPEDLHEAK